jgi:peroxin-3
MLRSLVLSLANDVYTSSSNTFRDFGANEQMAASERKRLAECLLVFTRWGQGVWEGVPDTGVEGLLSMGEFEGFAGLIFGDWSQ